MEMESCKAIQSEIRRLVRDVKTLIGESKNQAVP